MNKEIYAKFVDASEVSKELENIGFDCSYLHHAIKKNTYKTIKILNLRPQEASILKQSALALGFDAAVHRGVLDCSVETSDAILTGSDVQFEKLSKSIEHQPFKMKKVAAEINLLLDNSLLPIEIKGHIFDWSKPYLMGILNVTPDSFSDGGEYYTVDKAIKHFCRMVEDGADIIDIGAESTRPGHTPVSAEEEISRLKPILSELKKLDLKIPVSIDTRNISTAQTALESGADIINDVGISGFNKEMIEFVNSNNVPYIVTHNSTVSELCTDKVYQDLKNILEKITAPCIADVGIGFGKVSSQNVELIKRISEFSGLGVPLLVGHSRKSFLTKELHIDSEELDEATLAISSKLLTSGVNIIRVHEIKRHRLLVDLFENLA